MLQTPEEYAQSIVGPGRTWLEEFLAYMRDRYADISPLMFHQRPMYKIGESYILFTVAKEHFTVHTLNFDLIEGLRSTLRGASYGKGCVKVRFADEDAKPVLRALIDDIVRINRSPNAPPVDVTPALPYEEALAKALPGVRSKWLPLYSQLLIAARNALPEFVEYFPAINILWKHTSTFAQISATAGALRVEFYADAVHPERHPIKTAALSKTRVAHTVELTEESAFADIIAWIAESYRLTQKK